MDPEELSRRGIELIHVRDNRYVLRSGAESRHLIIEDLERKRLRISVDDRSFEVSIADHRDQLLASLGGDSDSDASQSRLDAPMPGLVLGVSVKEGDVVSKGQPVLVLEAMKMENDIKAPTDGAIRAILVSEGEAVQKGQPLIEFEVA